MNVLSLLNPIRFDFLTSLGAYNVRRISFRIPVLAALLAASSLAPRAVNAQYSVTFLHNNDGESRLLGYSDSLAEYGGPARFKTMLDQTRSFYASQGHGVVSIYAGDTFLAGPQFQASLDSGAPGSRTFYDALAISRMGYDASILGNHEFDFGPDVLAEFIGDAQTTNATTYLSSNLDFSAEAGLQAHVAAGRIAPTKLVTVSTAAGNKSVGIIGATTETLSFVSSPGAVAVNPVASAVNAQIANLQAAGADHIVLAGHLQGLGTDNALVSGLNPGIDLIIAGGGDELLRNAAATSPGTVYSGAPASIVDTGFIPGDGPVTLSGSLTGVANNYPVMSTVTDGGGNSIPMVTTGGNYGYLGRVTLNFDASGNLAGIDDSSGPQRVASTVADATHGVVSDPAVLADAVAPVQSFVAGLAANDLANTSVPFLHGGSPTIRSRETNLGNLVADGILRAGREQASTFGVDAPQIALVNGGGIRANISAGDVTQLNTFSVSPFGNFVAVVEDVKLADLKLLLENAYSRVTDDPSLPGVNPVSSDGRFAQIAGLEVVYDLSRAGFTFNADGSTITTPQRVRDIVIDGTAYLTDGVWQIDPAVVTVDIATLNFSAGGGDQWFRTSIGGTSTYMSQLYDFTAVGVTDQNALQQYVEAMAAGDPSYDISTFRPEYGIAQSFWGGRISVVPEPTGLVLAGLGALSLLGWHRARRQG